LKVPLSLSPRRGGALPRMGSTRALQLFETMSAYEGAVLEELA
jgi:DNA-binding GntR family transcriptional regulator